MAFRTLITAAFAVFVSTIPASAQECVTVDAFVEEVKTLAPIIMIAKADAAVKIVDRLNKNRAEMGSEPVMGKTVLIGFVDEPDGSVSIGVAIFDTNGCGIKDTVVLLKIEQWAAFATSAGVTADDFVVLQGA
jgi:hypothetical protein